MQLNNLLLGFMAASVVSAFTWGPPSFNDIKEGVEKLESDVNVIDENISEQGVTSERLIEGLRQYDDETQRFFNKVSVPEPGQFTAEEKTTLCTYEKKYFDSLNRVLKKLAAHGPTLKSVAHGKEISDFINPWGGFDAAALGDAAKQTDCEGIYPTAIDYEWRLAGEAWKQ